MGSFKAGMVWPGKRVAVLFLLILLPSWALAQEQSPESPDSPQGSQSPAAAWFESNQLSGFVSTSYFYNFNEPSTDLTTGRSFDIHHNEFSLNKFKLVLENPLEFSATQWDFGYRVDLVFGQDATLLQSLGLNLGDHGDVIQAYAVLNAPVGRGLQISAGKWVTLMGVEVIEEVSNPNWSEGNQFLFVENFTGTGVQLNYQWSDRVDTQFRIYNGWDVVKDNNNALSFMGRVGFSPDDNTTIGIIGYGGPEQAGDSDPWRKGIDIVISRQLNDKLAVSLQGDYGHETANPALPFPGSAEWWATGVWLTYDVTDKAGIALRWDYLNDKDGARTSGSPFVAPFPLNDGQELTGLTFTINLRPHENLIFRPEFRWDHSTLETAFDAEGNQVTLGFGIAYLF